MVQLTPSLAALAVFVLAGVSLAHPGHDINAEIAQRAEYARSIGFKNLDHCGDALKAREPEMIARRKAMVAELRKKRSIKKRDFDTVLNTNHHSNKSVTPQSSDLDVFGSNNSCILQAETTEGPYYVSGEYVRKDITDGHAGVDLTFDVQIIDTNTCQPLSNVALEAWHCNSTGVYGGVVAGGNGNQADTTNINNTMFRGIQISNANGILQFDTKFPGHYMGRATHIHVLAHHNATALPNNTLSGGTISHVGQLFFDQSLITQVETNSPYSTNTQALTTNANDGIMREESATSDPVLEYVYLGNAASEGIFGWITVGLDSKVSKTVSAAAYLDANGGHANPNAGGPGGPGGPPPSGFPSRRPTGTARPTGV